jgi:catabolite regulation protein CreA
MSSRSDERSIEVNRALLLSGVVLISTAALLGTVGGIATAVAVIGAARSWVRQLDEPPSTMARRRLAQARTAALAGAEGWRQHASANGGTARAQSAPIRTTQSEPGTYGTDG